MNNNTETISKMKELKLHGMARAFQTTLETGISSQYTTDELLTHLIDCEWDDRNNRRRERLKKAAHFRYNASFAEINYAHQRNLDKNQMLRFSNCSWISDHQDIIITGSTGVGKSFLGSALGHQACDYGYRVIYSLTSRLFADLKEAKREGNYHKLLLKILKADLLILEDFGLSPFTNDSRLALLDILEDRHGRKSTVFLSQLSVREWYEIIGDSTIADAIMDRIVHGSHRIELEGDTLRKINY